MIAIVLDIITGEVRSDTEHSSLDYASGNWSCDCNRRTLFEYLDPETNLSTHCESRRFIVIAAILFLPYEFPYSISELNEDYDQELISYYVNAMYEKHIEKAKV